MNKINGVAIPDNKSISLSLEMLFTELKISLFIKKFLSNRRDQVSEEENENENYKLNKLKKLQQQLYHMKIKWWI